MIKMFRGMNELGRAYVLEAHTYMMQPKLDYAKAARLFQLGVDHDSPEAMYNLVRAFSALSLRSSFLVFILWPSSSFFVLWSSFFTPK
jgi:hypothetical protein